MPRAKQKVATSYEDAVSWIAHNHNTGDPEALNEDAVSDDIIVAMVADLFKRERIRVARDIVKERQKARDEEG